MDITPEVSKAIEEVRASFAETKIDVEPDGAGGAFVKIETIQPGNQYDQTSTWVGFQITFQYPNSDVYPHFVRPDLSFRDKRSTEAGKPLGEASSLGEFMQVKAIQISQQSNRRKAELESAVIKLHKVIEWLNTR